METTKRYYRVDRREIYFLRFLLEAYEGIAGLSTIDSQKGIVLIRVSPGCEQELDTLIDDIQTHMLMRPIDEKTLVALCPDQAAEVLGPDFA